jgi:hypothetical protein
MGLATRHYFLSECYCLKFAVLYLRAPSLTIGRVCNLQCNHSLVIILYIIYFDGGGGYEGGYMMTERDCALKADIDRLCGLVVRVPGYLSRGPGSISIDTRFSEKWLVWNGVHSAS